MSRPKLLTINALWKAHETDTYCTLASASRMHRIPRPSRPNFHPVHSCWRFLLMCVAMNIRREAYIYLAHARDGIYKIGSSVNPRRRMQEIRLREGHQSSVKWPRSTWSPCTPELVHTIKADEISARDFERYIHGVLWVWHMTGEWFRLPDHAVQAISQISYLHTSKDASAGPWIYTGIVTRAAAIRCSTPLHISGDASALAAIARDTEGWDVERCLLQSLISSSQIEMAL